MSRRRNIRNVEKSRTEYEAVFESFALIEETEIQWLWPGRLPEGMLSILFGDPGAGKSLLSVDIAARISRGGDWPDVNWPPADKGKVLIITQEDDPSCTIKPRLIAAKAEDGNVLFFKGLRQTVTNTDDHTYDKYRSLSLLDDIYELRQMLKKIEKLRLIIVDPIADYLRGVDSHNNAEVRNALLPLIELASDLKVAILAITHSTKNSEARAIHRAMGSVGFVAAARSSWFVTKDPNNSDRRFFVPVKNNNAPDNSALAFSVVPDESSGYPRIVWEPEPILDLDPQLLMAGKGNVKTKVDEAAEWLLEYLKDGPKLSKAVKMVSKGKGHAWRTVQEAKRVLGIEPGKDGFGADGEWCCFLPEQFHLRAQDSEAEDSAHLAKNRKRKKLKESRFEYHKRDPRHIRDRHAKYEDEKRQHKRGRKRGRKRNLERKQLDEGV